MKAVFLLLPGARLTHLKHRTESTVLERDAPPWRTASKDGVSQLHSSPLCNLKTKPKEKHCWKDYCTITRHYLKRETKSLKPVYLLELKFWSDASAQAIEQRPSEDLCCFAVSQARKEGKEKVLEEITVRCSWVVLQRAAEAGDGRICLQTSYRTSSSNFVCEFLRRAEGPLVLQYTTRWKHSGHEKNREALLWFCDEKSDLSSQGPSFFKSLSRSLRNLPCQK